MIPTVLLSPAEANPANVPKARVAVGIGATEDEVELVSVAETVGMLVEMGAFVGEMAPVSVVGVARAKCVSEERAICSTAVGRFTMVEGKLYTAS